MTDKPLEQILGDFKQFLQKPSQEHQSDVTAFMDFAKKHGITEETLEALRKKYGLKLDYTESIEEIMAALVSLKDKDAAKKNTLKNRMKDAFDRYIKEKAEEERVIRLSFWRAVYNQLLEDNDEIETRIHQKRTKEYTVEIVWKGLLRNRTEIHKVPSQEFTIKYDGREVTSVTPDIVFLNSTKISNWKIDAIELEAIKTEYTSLQQCYKLKHDINFVKNLNIELLTGRDLPKQTEQYDSLISKLEQTILYVNIPAPSRIGRIAARIKAKPDFNYHYTEFKKQGNNYITALAS